MDIKDEIAIVGVGCKFPGADNLEEFWRVLVNGENHVIEIPKERWNNGAFYSENKDQNGKHYVKRAGLIKSHDEWDHRCFGVNANEAVRIDPQQRYVLECTHMAMEDGGITRASLKGSQTGVYIGVMNDDYKILASSDHNDDTNYTATGMSTTIIASRVSYTYDLQGPCMVIDTACSSSSIAIHLGSQAIKTGDCQMAICGGVTSIISPDTFITLSKARMMSAVGQCQTFCDTADGYARSEGCGIVILKTVKKALEDGDKIWAILYSGSNHDGHDTSPITAPSGNQQEKLLHKVYSQHNVDPTTLQYIELHGTGTPLGDPIETNALGRFIKSYRTDGKTRSKANLCGKSDKLQTDTDSGVARGNHCLDIKVESRSLEGNLEKEQRVENGSRLENEKHNSMQFKYETVPGDSLENDEDPLPQTEVKQMEKVEIGLDCVKKILEEKEDFIKIGSVKTNIGHTESAAGVAGLIKVLLMMQNGKLVPSLHLKTDKSNLNKNIKLDEYHLDIAQNVENWKPNIYGDRICCVNSFGFGGSNSHLIVIQRKCLLNPTTKHTDCDTLSPYAVFCLSAMDKIALKNTMQLFVNRLENTEVPMQDIAYTCAFRRDHYANRTMLYGTNVEQLKEQVKLKTKTIDEMKITVKTRIIFVFCGVGTTWKGMCSEFMNTQPIFRHKIEEIDGYLKPLTGWCIADKFKTDTDYSDPFLNHIAIFCVQVALVKLWEHFGITPDVIVGQSIGEVAASVASGSLSLKDGVSVVYYRSKILAKMTGGSMMVVGNVQVSKIQEMSDKYNNKVAIAVNNSPTSCTLSGDSDVIEKLKQDFEKLNTDKNILIRILSVQCAYHSHHVKSCMEDIEDHLKDINKGQRTIEHISTVTGEFATKDEFQTGSYWANNIRQPVMFMQAVLKASEENLTNVFIEIGPRQVLQAHLPNIMGENLHGKCLASMSVKKENTSIYASLNDVYQMGVKLNLKHIVPSYGSVVNIPKYGFNKSKLLYIPETAHQALKGISVVANTHMYVRQCGTENSEFRIEIDRITTPFVYDHLFQKSLLIPGSTFIEAAFEIGQRKTKYAVNELSVSVEFVKAFTPPEDARRLIEIEINEEKNMKGFEYRFFKDDVTFSKGTICSRPEQHERQLVEVDAIRERCKTYLSRQECYTYLKRLEFEYGDSLRLIQKAWSSETECIAEIRVSDSVKNQTKCTHLHPSIIDAMFQTFGIISSSASGFTIPKGAGSVVLDRFPKEHMVCYSQKVKSTKDVDHYNCLLLTRDGNVIAEVQDFTTRKLHKSNAPNQIIVYDVVWNELCIPENENGNDAAASNNIIVFGTNRFIKWFSPTMNKSNTIFYELKESLSDTESTFKQVFERRPTISAAVFAPCYHVQWTKNAERAVYDRSKDTFLSLALFIKELKNNNFKCPIFVITENVIAYPSLNIIASNICGGELWGMVRSAMAETAYNDIRIVDISLKDKNAEVLEYLIRSNTPNHNECIIHAGKLFVSEIIEAPKQHYEVNQREIDICETEELVLKSSHPFRIMKPHFKIGKSRTPANSVRMSSVVTIRIKSISLHNAAIYSTSTEYIDTQNNIWPESDTNGFEVIGIEGVGWIEMKNEPKEVRYDNTRSVSVGFCYPISVSPCVQIPAKCIFDTDNLPVYIPGIMTTGIILWNIAQSCKGSSNICVVVDDELSSTSLLMSSILANLTDSQIIFISTKDNHNVLKTNPRSTAHKAIILTKITQPHVEMLLKSFQTKVIISIDEYFPRAIQQWVCHNTENTKLQIFNTDKMFTYAELSKKIPKVHGWLKNLDNTVCQQLKKHTLIDTDPFKLPFQTLALHKSELNYTYIPLKVFKTEVFRKACCYIIIGGLTGLGWELLQLVAELGAGIIATFSRRRPTEEKQKQIDMVESVFGCKVVCVQIDITDLKALKRAMKYLQSLITDTRIKGVFHGGGVVNDMLLSKMTAIDLGKSLEPKIQGTWNLHLVTKDIPLDFFVMHSSIVSILGNPGQCNYAAGNSFQDSFAHYRRSLGLCGQSINWGALSIGMATKNKEIENHLRSQGFIYLSKEDIRSCFIRAVMTNVPQVTFAIFDWSRMESHPIVKMYPNKFARLLDSYGPKIQIIQHIDSKYHLDKQCAMISDLITKMVSDTFMVEMSSLGEDTRFVTLGIDSMAAMSFTNSIFEATQVRISMLTLLSETTTIGSLTMCIFENLHTVSSENKTKAVDHSRNSHSLLEGSTTFMQRSFLKDFMKNPLSQNFLRQADYQIEGLIMYPKDWKVILNHLLKMNPELRKIYTINIEENKFESRRLSLDEVKIDIENVPFDSICNEGAWDERANNCFDLTKELPIKFKIACLKNKTRIRMYLSSVISDLSGISLLSVDMASLVISYISNKPLPENDTNIDPVKCVREALAPRMLDMKQYWKQQMSQDIQPFTFSKDIEKELNESDWLQVNHDLPQGLAHSVLEYVQKRSISLYDFVMSAYMALLHKKTCKDLIPLVTNIDMRGHVPQLRQFVTRCNNVIPVIGDQRNMGTVDEYIQKSSARLQKMTQQSGYPFELIEEEIQTDTLRKYIGRHRLIMDNMTKVNQTFKQKHVTVKLMNIFHTRHVYETTLLVWYDLLQNRITFEYGYNSDSLQNSQAVAVPVELMKLMQAFIKYPSATVLDVLAGNRVISESCPITGYQRTGSVAMPVVYNSVTESYEKRATIDISTDCLIEQKCTWANSFSDTKSKDGGFVILKEDFFQKQTTNGWDHDVFVVMTKNASQAEVLLQWGDNRKDRRRNVSLKTITEVHVKKLHGQKSKQGNKKINIPDRDVRNLAAASKQIDSTKDQITDSSRSVDGFNEIRNRTESSPKWNRWRKTLTKYYR